MAHIVLPEHTVMLINNNLLLELDLFKKFYTEEVQILSEYFSCHKFFPEQVMMRKGEVGTYLGIITSGEVKIIDNEEVIATLTQGDLLGEIALIQSSPRTVNVVAASEGEIAIITFDDIEKLYSNQCNLGVKLIDVLTESAVKRLLKDQNRDTNQYVALLASEQKTVELVDFVLQHKDFFSIHAIAATAAIGEILQQQTGVTIRKTIQAKHLIAGDQGIGSLILSENIQAIIYIRKPLAPIEEQPELEALSRLSDLHQVPFATNLTTAEAIVHYLNECQLKSLSTFPNLKTPTSAQPSA
ncbi:MAG: cyclic nucleotide-binding domain-containing protein [Symploca sp. SIO2E6]|nr:cyclic nucleotide-binding domain-containing protein [Symploca sp. SIO2E6]